MLLKQFALVALPFLALAALQRHTRPTWRVPRGLFVGVVAVGVLPFVVWDPGAFWADTIEYGGKTYRIVGYGLSGLLVEGGLIDRRTDPYPFLPLLALVWLPRRCGCCGVPAGRDLWVAAGFAVSFFMLVFLGRVFQPSYLVWPLAGLVTAVLLAVPGQEPLAKQLR